MATLGVLLHGGAILGVERSTWGLLLTARTLRAECTRRGNGHGCSRNTNLDNQSQHWSA